MPSWWPINFTARIYHHQQSWHVTKAPDFINFSYFYSDPVYTIVIVRFISILYISISYIISRPYYFPWRLRNVSSRGVVTGMADSSWECESVMLLRVDLRLRGQVRSPIRDKNYSLREVAKIYIYLYYFWIKYVSILTALLLSITIALYIYSGSVIPSQSGVAEVLKHVFVIFWL